MPAWKKIGHIGPYRIAKPLNEGGMAVILLAYHQNRPVALKLSRPVRNEEKQHIFNLAIKKEAEFLSKAEHPRIVRIYPIESPYGKGIRTTFTARATEFPTRPWYMLLEYLPGGTLDAFVKAEGPLTVFEATNIAGNIGLGLNYLHNYLHVVHKDLSPRNIVFRTPPQRHQSFDPVIIDFGAIVGAKRQNENVEIGALYIMSPERVRQARGEAPPEVTMRVDKRKADIWALGVLLYYMLTKHYPFSARSPAKLSSQIVTDTPEPIQKWNTEVPPELSEFILWHMLAKNPAERPTIKEVLRFLKQYGSSARRLSAP